MIRMYLARAAAWSMVLLFFFNSAVHDAAIAQEAPQESPGPIFLVTGVDVNGEGFPIAIVDLGTGEARTLATFASNSVCPPTITPNGAVLLYEVATSPSQTTIYQLDTASGQRNVLLDTLEYHLGCPVIGPRGERIAWVHPPVSPDEDAVLVVSDMTGDLQRDMAHYPQIYDVIWSPAGSLLVYNTTSPEVPYPTLYSLPTEGEAEPYAFWSPQQGFVLDYEFAADGGGLLVAYATDTNVAITVLPVECVIGISTRCETDPIATFPAEANIDLLNAYSPFTNETAISVQFPDPTVGFPKADLWIIDLSGSDEPRQLTFSPTLLKTGAFWAANGREIYFVGTSLDPESGSLQGAIYSVPIGGERQVTLRFTSDIFSPASILWRLDR